MDAKHASLLCAPAAAAEPADIVTDTPSANGLETVAFPTGMLPCTATPSATSNRGEWGDS